MAVLINDRFNDGGFTMSLTPRLAAWLLRSHTALNNFLEDILQPTKSKMSPTSNLGL